MVKFDSTAPKLEDYYRVFTSLISSDPTEDITQTETEATIKVDLPGLKKEDLSITFENNLISISGIRKDTNYKYSYAWKVNFSVDSENIKAKLDLGVLVVTLPKLNKKSTSKIHIE